MATRFAAIVEWGEETQRQIVLWWHRSGRNDLRTVGPQAVAAAACVGLWHLARAQAVQVWVLGPDFVGLAFVAVFLVGFELGRGGWTHFMAAIAALERRDDGEKE